MFEQPFFLTSNSNTLVNSDMASDTTSKLPSHLGFVGLGIMGFPMFCNLASKIPASSTVHFYDVNPDSMERALKEPGLVAKLDRCSSAREVAEKSVC